MSHLLIRASEVSVLSVDMKSCLMLQVSDRQLSVGSPSTSCPSPDLKGAIVYSLEGLAAAAADWLSCFCWGRFVQLGKGGPKLWLASQFCRVDSFYCGHTALLSFQSACS